MKKIERVEVGGVVCCIDSYGYFYIPISIGASEYYVGLSGEIYTMLHDEEGESFGWIADSPLEVLGQFPSY